MGGSSSPPSPPTNNTPPPNIGAIYDPASVSAQQTAANTTAGIESQAGSNYNQVGPYGSTSYAQTGTGPNGVPIYTATTSLSPQQQQLYNTIQSLGQTGGTQAQGVLQNANYAGTNANQVIGDQTKGLTGQYVNAQTQYLQPYFQQATEQLDSQLRNQGFAPGERGYDDAMQNLQKSQAGTIAQAAAQFEPQAFQQASSEYLMPLQEASTLGSFVPQMQNPTTGYGATNNLSISPAPISNIYGTAGQLAETNYANELQSYQQQLQAWEAQQQQKANMMSGLFGIGSNVAGGLARNSGFTGGMGSALGGLFGGGGGAGVAGLPMEALAFA